MTNPTTVRSQIEIDEIIDWCVEDVTYGSKRPTWHYEEGVKDAVYWLIGKSDTRPDR